MLVGPYYFLKVLANLILSHPVQIEILSTFVYAHMMAFHLARFQLTLFLVNCQCLGPIIGNKTNGFAVMHLIYPLHTVMHTLEPSFVNVLLHCSPSLMKLIGWVCSFFWMWCTAI